MKKICLFLILCAIGYAQQGAITLDWLKTKPKSNAKDFYIWQYLKQDINNSAANEAYMLSNLKENVLLKREFKKFTKEKVPQIQKTLPMVPTESNNTQQIVVQPVLEEPKKNTLPAVIAHQNIKPKNIIRGVTDLNETLFQKSILKLEIDERYSFSETFYLFLNALRHQEMSAAKEYLKSAKQKATKQVEIDKVNFWSFLAFRDEGAFKEVAKSYSMNLYSVYAKEKLGVVAQNVFFDVNSSAFSKETNMSVDVHDPFLCIPCIAKTVKDDQQTFDKYKKIFATSPKYKPQLAYLLSHESDYTKSYFLMPYDELLPSHISEHRKALIYAIARQESRFLPNAVSTAFALGVMQVMPYVGADMASMLKEKYSVFDQFKPENNIKLANKLLDLLENELDHPLFVAYAYNGGIAMLKKYLKRGYYFKAGQYEPFMSLELFPVGESREYAKQVLANYVIYRNHISQEKIKLEDLLGYLKD